MIRCSFSTFTENKSKPRELPKGSVVNSLFFDLTMLRLRIERHQIAARNYDDDDHHSFIGSIIIAIMRFFYLSGQARYWLGSSFISFASPFSLDYRRAKGNPWSNIKWSLLMSDRSIRIGPLTKVNFKGLRTIKMGSHLIKLTFQPF